MDEYKLMFLGYKLGSAHVFTFHDVALGEWSFNYDAQSEFHSIAREKNLFFVRRNRNFREKAEKVTRFDKNWERLGKRLKISIWKRTLFEEIVNLSRKLNFKIYQAIVMGNIQKEKLYSTFLVYFKLTKYLKKIFKLFDFLENKI